MGISQQWICISVGFWTRRRNKALYPYWYLLLAWSSFNVLTMRWNETLPSEPLIWTPYRLRSQAYPPSHACLCRRLYYEDNVHKGFQLEFPQVPQAIEMCWTLQICWHSDRQPIGEWGARSQRDYCGASIELALKDAFSGGATTAVSSTIGRRKL